MFCTKCGANNADGAKFCIKCGNPISSVAATPSGSFGGAKSANASVKRINPRDYFKQPTDLDGRPVPPPKPIVPDIPVEPLEVDKAEVAQAVNSEPVERPLEFVTETEETNAEVKQPQTVDVNITSQAQAEVQMQPQAQTQAQAEVQIQPQAQTQAEVQVQTQGNQSAKENNEETVIKTEQQIDFQKEVKQVAKENESINITLNDEIVENTERKKKKVRKEKKKGRKKGLKITCIVILVIAVLSALGFFFRHFFMFHLTPRIYTMSATSKTIDVLNSELEAVGMNLTGVDMESEELTVKLSAAVTGLKGNKNIKDAATDIAISRSKKDVNFKVNADAVIDGVAYEMVDALWDDSVIAVKSTAVMGEETVYTVPSKDFGKKFNESALADDFDVPKNLDLAASNFISDKKVEDKETVKKLTEAVTKVVNNSEVENKETVKLTVDGKERNVHKLDFALEDKDFVEFMKDLVKISKDSKTMRFAYEMLMMGYETEEELEEDLEDIEFDDINLSFYIYNGMVVRCDISNDSQTIFFGFTKTKNLLDNFTAGSIYESEYDGEKVEWTETITCEGNLTTGEDKVENVYTFLSEKDGEASEKIVTTLSVDFKKGEFNLNIADALDEDDDVDEFLISGTCTRGKEGFKIALGDVERVRGDKSYSMIPLIAKEVKLEMEITPKAGVKIAPLDENRVDVLDMTEEKFDDFNEKIAEGIKKIFKLK